MDNDCIESRQICIECLILILMAEKKSVCGIPRKRVDVIENGIGKSRIRVIEKKDMNERIP